MQLNAHDAETEMEMNMTPMIDVTFQLLIFFIVTMKFRLLEKKLHSYLPTDFGTNSSPEIIDEIFITVKLKQPLQSEDARPIRQRTTRYFVETEQIEGSSTSDILKQIRAKISKFRSDQKDAKGKIEAALGVPHRKVVDVLDLFHEAQYEQITFVGLATNLKISEGDFWWNQIRTKLGDN